MPRLLDLFLAALAPAVWGSTYWVTSQFLPAGAPLTMAALRILPAGLLLLLWARQLPSGIWWLRVFILGGFNFTLFQAVLFIAAYRLPGGVAATLGAVQPLVVVLLAAAWLNTPITFRAIAASLAGLTGVGSLVLTPQAALDPMGIAAALTGAAAMAAGTVLTRKWQPPVPLLTFTAWQLTAGGVLLLPLVAWLEPGFPVFDANGIWAMGYLSLIGAGAAYALWFRGVSRIEPAQIAPLGFFSPLTAVLLGWLLLGQNLGPLQLAGISLILGSVWVSQTRARTASLLLKEART